MKKIEIEYALAKQIPAARHKMNIETDYGDMTLWGDDAAYITGHIETLLNYKLSMGDYEEDDF